MLHIEWFFIRRPVNVKFVKSVGGAMRAYAWGCFVRLHAVLVSPPVIEKKALLIFIVSTLFIEAIPYPFVSRLCHDTAYSLEIIHNSYAKRRINLQYYICLLRGLDMCMESTNNSNANA